MNFVLMLATVAVMGPCGEKVCEVTPPKALDQAVVETTNLAGTVAWRFRFDGAELAWIYKTGAGIATDPKAPGYQNIVMAPKPDRPLDHMKAQYKTRFGLVESAWRYDGETWVRDVTIPVGATASITLPGEKQTRTYPKGTYRFTRKGL